MTTDSKEVAMGAQQGAAGQAADPDEWRHVREVLARRTPDSTLTVNRYGAYVMVAVAGKLRDMTVLHITRTDDQDQTERDLDALSILWNTADALLSALARERRRVAALERGMKQIMRATDEWGFSVVDEVREIAAELLKDAPGRPAGKERGSDRSAHHAGAAGGTAAAARGGDTGPVGGRNRLGYVRGRCSD